jgi:hypothetical protein
LNVDLGAAGAPGPPATILSDPSAERRAALALAHVEALEELGLAPRTLRAYVQRKLRASEDDPVGAFRDDLLTWLDQQPAWMELPRKQRAVVATAIRRHLGLEDGLTASYQTYADEARAGKSTARRALGELARAGLLVRIGDRRRPEGTDRRQTSNQYFPAPVFYAARGLTMPARLVEEIAGQRREGVTLTTRDDHPEVPGLTTRNDHPADHPADHPRSFAEEEDFVFRGRLPQGGAIQKSSYSELPANGGSRASAREPTIMETALRVGLRAASHPEDDLGRHEAGQSQNGQITIGDVLVAGRCHASNNSHESWRDDPRLDDAWLKVEFDYPGGLRYRELIEQWVRDAGWRPREGLNGLVRMLDAATGHVLDDIAWAAE